MRKPSLYFALPLTLLGCASLLPEHPTYLYNLSSVQRPEQAKERYGPERLAVFSDSGKTKFSFEDSLVRVVVFPSETGFFFRLDNKTPHSIRIIWDDAAIVGPSGESGRVMHSGVKYVDRNNSEPPTVVVAHGFVTDEAVPTANVSMSSLYSGWETEPLLPRPSFQTKNRDVILGNLREKYKGKTVQLLLPLQIEGVTNDYLFTFTVSDVVSDHLVAYLSVTPRERS